MIDLHVHTWRCRHAEGSAEEYVLAAADRDIRTLAFTEHMPLPLALRTAVPGAEGYAMPLAELPEYAHEVARAAALGTELGVEVLFGVEVDAIPGALEHAFALVAEYPFDVVLGSVHFIGDWAFDDPDQAARYGDWDLGELWERYFSDLIAAAHSGLADVIAHADLVKKFRKYPAGAVGHLYAHAADAIAEAGVAVEVNTAGLRKPCAELYPAPAFLRELKRAGVPVTIGSDAHRPEDVGAGGSEALAALAGAGYDSVLVFRARVPEEVGLSEL